MVALTPRFTLLATFCSLAALTSSPFVSAIVLPQYHHADTAPLNPIARAADVFFSKRVFDDTNLRDQKTFSQRRAVAFDKRKVAYTGKGPLARDHHRSSVVIPNNHGGSYIVPNSRRDPSNSPPSRRNHHVAIVEKNSIRKRDDDTRVPGCIAIVVSYLSSCVNNLD